MKGTSIHPDHQKQAPEDDEQMPVINIISSSNEDNETMAVVDIDSEGTAAAKNDKPKKKRRSHPPAPSASERSTSCHDTDNRPIKKTRVVNEPRASVMPHRCISRRSHHEIAPPTSTSPADKAEDNVEQLKATALKLRQEKKLLEARTLLERVVTMESAAVAKTNRSSLTVTEQEQRPQDHDKGVYNHCRYQLMKSLTELGTLCFDLEDLDAAMNYHNTALNIYLDGCLVCHAFLAILNLRHVAAIYIRCGMCHEALMCYSFIYKIQQESQHFRWRRQQQPHITGATNSCISSGGVQDNDDNDTDPNAVPSTEIASTLSCMGLMNYLLRRFPAALRFYQEELELRMQLHSDGTMEHEDIAISLNSIGIVYFQMGELEEAQQAFESCLKIRRALLRQGHPAATTITEEQLLEDACIMDNNNNCNKNRGYDIAMVYYNLAAILMRQGDEATASKLYQQSMKLKRAIFGNHPEIAIDYQYLGQMYLDHGDSQAAIDYYKEALKIVQAMSPVSSAPTIANADSTPSSSHTVPTAPTAPTAPKAAVEAEDRGDGTPTTTTLTTRSAEQKLLVIIGNIYLLEANIAEMMANFEKAARLEEGANTDFREKVKTFGYHFYSISRMHPRCAPLA